MPSTQSTGKFFSKNDKYFEKLSKDKMPPARRLGASYGNAKHSKYGLHLLEK